MHFPKLEIENFMAITAAEIDLANRGLVAIQGVNNADTSAKSNGAGKSSIADALCWCLYGTTARGESGDSVINQTAGKNCRVSVTLTDGAQTYIITRHRKHKTGKNSLHLKLHDGLKETDLTKGTDKLTQEAVTKIIGSSLDVFSGSIYAGQEKMPDLPAMTDKTLKLLIEEAAGSLMLEDAYKLAREDVQAASAKQDHTFSTWKAATERVSEIGRQREEADLFAEDWSKGRDRRLNDAMGQARAFIGKVKTLDLAIKAADPARLTNEIEKIDAKIAGVSGENTQLAKMERTVANMQSRINAAAGSYRSEKHAIEQLQHQLAHVNAKIGDPCGECGREITTAELSATTKSIEDKIETHERLQKDYASEYAAAKKDLEAAAVARDSFAASMTDISAHQMERRRLEEKQTEYQKLVTDRRFIMAEITAVKDKIATIRAEENPYAAQGKRLETEEAQWKGKVTDTQKAMEAAQKACEVAKEVARVFSPAGVRARILDEVTPFLNAQTSKYLDTLSDGNISATWSTLTAAAKKGEFKEKFSIEVVNGSGGKSFALLSGGEKRKTRVATALALQDLVATRASKPIDLFIGDEIDDALDAAGLERLMLILEEKARERGSVFVISHNDLADEIRQTLTIEKTSSGETKITEVVS